MLYYGERKKGCRFIEVLFHGYRTLIIENDLIRTMLLVDKGVDIISLVHKKSDTDFVWTNPMGLSCLEKRRIAIMDDDCYSDNYVGGMFEILPNFGNPCEYKNVKLTRHSEVSLLPWDVQILEDSAQCIKFKFTVKLSKFPFMLTKILTIKSDSMELLFEEELYNLGADELPYLWAQHPCIGKPFLDENCIIELPFAENIEMPKEGSEFQSFNLFDVGEYNYASIKNRKTNLGITFSFDRDTYSHCGLWIKAMYDYGHHQHSAGYVMSVLPFNCEKLTLLEAAELGAAPIIKPQERKKSWYKISIFETV